MKTVTLFTLLIWCSLILSCTNESPVTKVDPLYETVPDIASCAPGSLSETEKQKVLNYVNTVRATFNLPAVQYDDKKDRLAQEAALIGAANASIAEAITDADFCYLRNAALEYQNGNRSLWGSATSKWPISEIHVNDWMAELNSENVNYRRRLLDPFLKSITFGRVIGTPKKGEYKYVSSAILITGYGNTDLSESKLEYVAHPHGNCSAKLFDPNSFLNFSVFYDKQNKSNNGATSVDFADATVEVSVGSQQSLEIVGDSFTYDYNSYGLPNNMRWKVQGLTSNVTYTVKISGIKVAGESKDYEYTFSFR
jgi:hypothetical protein